MQPTLFFIPHQWLGWPLLIVWLLVCAVILVYQYRKSGWSDEVKGLLPMAGMVAAAILFLLPNVEVMGVDPNNPLGPPINRGLAVRGYGVCMLLAIVAGMAVVILRSKKIGFPVDPIFSLAFCMVIAGVVGARLFYVIQKNEQFFGPDIPLGDSLKMALNMTGGGLVVYGSLFGASIAAFIFFWWSKLPVWKTADLLAPGMAIGLAIGRIGCLMNGCCWGGVCDANLPSIQFPAGAAPYMQHLTDGELLGLKTKPVLDSAGSKTYGSRAVVDVGPGVGESLGIEPGDEIAVETISPDQIRYVKAYRPELEKEASINVLVRRDGIKRNSVLLSELPPSSMRVHPTQLYSSANAFLLCLLLWFYWHHRKSDGEVFALMLILYPIGRFMIEIIRNDEAGQFGTEFTISQWVSFATVLIGFMIFAWCRAFGSRSSDDAVATKQ